LNSDRFAEDAEREKERKGEKSRCLSTARRSALTRPANARKEKKGEGHYIAASASRSRIRRMARKKEKKGEERCPEIPRCLAENRAKENAARLRSNLRVRYFIKKKKREIGLCPHGCAITSICPRDKKKSYASCRDDHRRGPLRSKRKRKKGRSFGAERSWESNLGAPKKN